VTLGTCSDTGEGFRDLCPLFGLLWLPLLGVSSVEREVLDLDELGMAFEAKEAPNVAAPRRVVKGLRLLKWLSSIEGGRDRGFEVLAVLKGASKYSIGALSPRGVRGGLSGGEASGDTGREWSSPCPDRLLCFTLRALLK
jgi:hypothetical protein